MNKTSETIHAETSDLAIQQAMTLLNVPASNLDVTAIAEGTYFAAIKNMDAFIQFAVSDDGMEVTVSQAGNSRGAGQPFSEALVRAALAKQKISAEIPSERMSQLIDGIDDASALEGMVVAEGVRPIDGWDGSVELRVNTNISAGEEDDHHRVDYHERGAVETVRAGDILGKVIFPAEGCPGRDVFGKVVAAKSGKAPPFEAGEGVSVAEDGTVRATQNGMVRFVSKVLSITEVFEQSGDVDFHTGNIHMDEGSLVIRGTVFPGFEVSALGNVVIGKTVREVRIHSGGDIQLQQGMIDASASAAGTFFANFAQNSTIEAAGNVAVVNNLHNCTVTAGDSVFVKSGKGIVRGGTIRCANTFEAKEVGSASEVETVIELDNQSAEELELIAAKKSTADAISEINRFLGCEDGAPDLSKKSASEQEAIQKVLETLRELQARRSEISAQLAALIRARLESSRFHIIVLNVVHPGTQLSIVGKKFLVNQPLSRCMFTYSQDVDKIIVQSI